MCVTGLSTVTKANSLMLPHQQTSRESSSAPVSRSSSPELPSSRDITMWIGSDSGV